MTESEISQNASTIEKEKLLEFDNDFLLPCALHENAYHLEIDPIDEDGSNIPRCPDCGKMLNFDSCWWCGATWLVFGSSWDDVMADAGATSSGDLVCVVCAREEAEEEESEWDQETEAWEEA